MRPDGSPGGIAETKPIYIFSYGIRAFFLHHVKLFIDSPCPDLCTTIWLGDGEARWG
jgi:hypothetical protein